MTEGELEIGQIASMLHKEETVAEIMEDIVADFNKTMSKLGDLKLWKWIYIYDKIYTSYIRQRLNSDLQHGYQHAICIREHPL